jgi:parvulin-like peptidyl-prolyl isomerase
MKKLKHKVRRLLRKESAPDEPVAPGRITNETVAEHREKILAGARRFKYPRQYAQHRLIRNSILISVGAILLIGLFVWQQLYFGQNTSKFFYRITQIVPVPVAKVDGEYVRYSDYLRELRSELHYLATEENVAFNSEDGKRQLEFRKRTSLNRVQEHAYVAKLAKEYDVRVTNQEIDDFIDAQISNNTAPITKEQFVQTVLPRYYDWSLGEYRDSIRAQLLKRKVAFAVDDNARQKINGLLEDVRGDAKFDAVAKKESDDETTKSRGGDVGWVSVNSDDPDGLIEVANGLRKNQVSDVVEGQSGYYIVKLLDKRNDEIRYSRIFVNLSELSDRLSELRVNQDLIREYIDVPEASAPTTRE